MKFLLFSLAGGLVMLVAVIALYHSGPGGDHGFLVEKLTGLHIDAARPAQRLMFVGFFFAFAVKAPMWPVHTWLPDAATEAPAGDGGAAGRRAGQGRHLRDDPLLPAAVPRGRQVGDARWSSSWP